MELWKKQKKVLAAFGIFLALMFLCTLISRAVYASGLPQVTVDMPRRMAIDHTVNAEGIVHQGREYAVTALSGLRVRTVYANVGDKVTPETLLFDLDLEDLKERIQEKELEIRKLQLQIAAMEQNQSLDTQKQQTENSRAREDYSRAADKAEESLARAREDLENAENAYDDHADASVHVTSQEDRRKQQEAYEAWVKEGKELQDAADAAKAAYEEAEKRVKELEVPQNIPEEGAEPKEEDPVSAPPDEDPKLQSARQEAEEKKKLWESAGTAYERHMENPVQQPDFSGEDAAREAWKEKQESLQDAVDTARRNVEDAERSQTDAMLDAGRAVEDTELPASADSSLAVSRLELSALQKTLAACKEVQDASGQVYPETEGIVTRIQVSPGERVGDGAAVVYADLSSPMQFQVSLTKAQKKYVNQGDTAKLTLGGSSGTELQVDYIAENEMNPELYDARIFLPEGVGTIGQSGSFQVEAQSETFTCCIPLNALHEDSNQRNFVYIVSERSGILGTELAAEMVYVKVLDRNDNYAAIEEGVIDRETELIVSSTEELEDKCVIRYKE